MNGMKKLGLLGLCLLGCTNSVIPTNNQPKIYYNVKCGYDNNDTLIVVYGNYNDNEYYTIKDNDTFEYILLDMELWVDNKHMKNMFYVFTYKYRLVVGKS
jgi:hypothetical protein